MKLIGRAIDAFDNYLLRPIPARLIGRLRLRLWSFQGATIGKEIVLGSGIRLVGMSGLTLEDGVSIARDVTLDARGGLFLKESALIGFESIILTSTHNSGLLGVAVQEQGMFQASTTIGCRSWLGTRVIIQPGVDIGDDSIIGSGAVVTKDVPKLTIAGGIPCREIRKR